MWNRLYETVLVSYLVSFHLETNPFASLAKTLEFIEENAHVAVQEKVLTKIFTKNSHPLFSPPSPTVSPGSSFFSHFCERHKRLGKKKNRTNAISHALENSIRGPGVTFHHMLSIQRPAGKFF